MREGATVVAHTAYAGPERPPVIAFDEAAFAPAARQAAPPVPVRIVSIPVPLPLPGQLKRLPPLPYAQPVDERPPGQRVDDANAAAAAEPEARGYINAMQVYPYVVGALYQLYAAPERVSAIALQPGETVVAVSAGDTTRWVIADTVSGTGAGTRTRILVKPVAEDLATNLVIVTDRRAYHLELASTPETYMASLSWHYPHDELLALQRKNKAAGTASVNDSGLKLDDLRFRYRITGDTPPWRPVRVFDDTAKVYIQFPARLDEGKAPPRFVVGGVCMPRKRRKTQRLKVVNPDCAGIDIGKDRHFVAIDPERCSEPVRSFDSFTPGLLTRRF